MKPVLLCSDRPLFRWAIARLLSEWLGVPVEEAPDRQELIHSIVERQPELAILDLAEGLDLRLLSELQESARTCVFVVVARRLSPDLVHHIADSGCYSVVSESAGLEQFRSTVLAAMQGQTAIDPGSLPEGYTEEWIPLSPREAQLVALVAQGMKNREIAEALNLSVGTVKVYLSHLFNKLHVRDRFELALYALRNMHSLGVEEGSLQGRPEMESPAEAALRGEWRGTAGRRMRAAARTRRIAP